LRPLTLGGRSGKHEHPEAFDARDRSFTRRRSGWSVTFILSASRSPLAAPATSTGFGCNALMVPGHNPYTGSSATQFINASALAQALTVTAVGQTDLSPLGGAAAQVTGSPFRRLDLSLFKQFYVTERAYFEFRAEASNVSNTPNFANSRT
jgi:hypothetical protein